MFNYVSPIVGIPNKTNDFVIKVCFLEFVISSSENFESIFFFKKLPSYLFDGLEHGALETIGWTVPGDVAPYLQVLGVVRHIEYPTIYTNLRYYVVGFFFHQKYTKNLLSFAKRFRKIRIRKFFFIRS